MRKCGSGVCKAEEGPEDTGRGMLHGGHAREDGGVWMGMG